MDCTVNTWGRAILCLVLQFDLVILNGVPAFGVSGASWTSFQKQRWVGSKVSDLLLSLQ
jgi:hypothetical protein